MPTVDELLRGHVTLEVECVDRLYLNGYVPSLVTAGGLVSFLRDHLGKPIPSPAVLGQISTRFRDAVGAFAKAGSIPLIPFVHGERKDDRANQLRRERPVRGEVVFIGVAQEKAVTFSGRQMKEKGVGWFDYTRDKSVYVNHYYFYVDDLEFGPAFIKVCSYAPWALKVCLNGHEWAKRQLDKRGIAYEALDNGFLSCPDPQALQEVCDALGPAQIEAFLARWLERLPMPLTAEDRAAGYDWKLSIWQMGSEPDPGFRTAPPGSRILRRGDPGESRPGSAGPNPTDLRATHPGSTRGKLPHPRHPARSFSEPARRVPQL